MRRALGFLAGVLVGQWLVFGSALSPADRTFAIKDLCTRYSTDIEALSRAAWMNWDDLSEDALICKKSVY